MKFVSVLLLLGVVCAQDDAAAADAAPEADAAATPEADAAPADEAPAADDAGDDAAEAPVDDAAPGDADVPEEDVDDLDAAYYAELDTLDPYDSELNVYMGSEMNNRVGYDDDMGRVNANLGGEDYGWEFKRAGAQIAKVGAAIALSNVALTLF